MQHTNTKIVALQACTKKARYQLKLISNELTKALIVIYIPKIFTKKDGQLTFFNLLTAFIYVFFASYFTIMTGIEDSSMTFWLTLPMSAPLKSPSPRLPMIIMSLCS